MVRTAHAIWLSCLLVSPLGAAADIPEAVAGLDALYFGPVGELVAERKARARASIATGAEEHPDTRRTFGVIFNAAAPAARIEALTRSYGLDLVATRFLLPMPDGRVTTVENRNYVGVEGTVQERIAHRLEIGAILTDGFGQLHSAKQRATAHALRQRPGVWAAEFIGTYRDVWDMAANEPDIGSVTDGIRDTSGLLDQLKQLPMRKLEDLSAIRELGR